MTKTFSTKLDIKVLHLLDTFCHKYHLKKTSLLEEIIAEGIGKRKEIFGLAESIERGLEEERQNNFYMAEEVENLVFGKKKPE